MARLLACWELGLGNGHINHLASAARGLAALGHESWLVTRDVVTARVLGDRPFAGVLQAPLWTRSLVTTMTYSYGQVIADGGFADDDGLAELVRAWLTLFDLLKPDGLYVEHAPAALLAAHVARLPAATVGTPFTCPRIERPMPELVPWLPESRARRAGADAVPDRVIRSVCRTFGVPVLGGVADLLATAAPFLVSWPELDPFGGRPDSAFYGPLDGIGASARPDWPAARGPRVFVYVPFDRPIAIPIAEALAQRGWPVVWVSSALPSFDLPASIRHEVEPVDTAMAMADATLVVHRGGHGLCLDAIRAACPQVLVPDRVEARTHALQVAARGLGRLPPEWTAASIGATLDALALRDAPEVAACAAAAARHSGYDPVAMALQLGRDMAAALRID
jgi:UDP:flavonoid glycosyltransferase YjiC (YdhE family)